MDRLQSGLGWVLVAAGFVLIFALDPILGGGEALSAFDQVERRIPGGAVMGLGLAVAKLRSLRPVLPFIILL